MRQSIARPLTFLFVCAALASLTACSSKNKGKIVGKWKMATPPGVDEKTTQVLEMAKAYQYIEFKADGSFETGIGAEDPNVAKTIAALADGKMLRGRYKLLMGNGVELSAEGGKGIFEGKDRGRGNIVINGDEMTLKDSKTSINCTRVK